MRILHLSDIHFGLDNDGKPKHVFTTEGKQDPDTLANTLADKLHEIGQPDLIVISGDIGWSGKPDDYDVALQACNRLRDKFGERIFIVPGNHDVVRNTSVSDIDHRQDPFIEFIEKFYNKSDLSRWYPLYDNKRLPTRESLVALFRDDHRRVIVVGINTAARIGVEDHCRKCKRRSATHGKCTECKLPLPQPTQSISISGRVLTEIRRELDSKEDWFKILVMHHNMFPFEEPDPKGHIDSANPMNKIDEEMVVNSAAFQGWLAKQGVHLVLHGHKHQPNGRIDTLYRRDDPHGASIVALGAGSAGVEENDRTPEALGFFVVEIERLSHKRFRLRASPWQIEASSITPNVRRDFEPFSVEIGPLPPEPPLVFYADSIGDCHRAIAASAKPEKLFRNFISIVDFKASTAFEVPATAERLGKAVPLTDVELSFKALHPEWDSKHGWRDRDAVQARLESLRPRFVFRHGPQMFKGGNDGRWPIDRAIDELKSGFGTTSNAFVSIFGPDSESRETGATPPALTGVQFSGDKARRRLDITLMFRKLDLAFWWSVNMYEALELWKYALASIKQQVESGRIMLVANLAEWKLEDTAAFTNPLDEMRLDDRDQLFYLAVKAELGEPTELLSLLREKRHRTNANNIDAHGLRMLADVVGALLNLRSFKGSLWKVLQPALHEASENLEKAEMSAKKRDHQVVQKHLQEAAAALESIEKRLESATRLQPPG